MRGGALPPTLLFIGLVMALAFAPRRALVPSLVAALAASVSVMLAPLPETWSEVVFLGCWLTAATTAATVYLPRPIGPRAAVALAANTGVWAGAAVAVAGRPSDLALAAIGLLLFVPAAWLVRTGRAIAVKVAASWLLAVALLAATLPAAVTTPGYEPDHAE